MPVRRVAILVPGGGASSPFTTPDQACATGYAAGGQLTAMRAALLEAGIPAYTAPARVGGGVIDEDPGWCAFADGPAPLPAEMTIDSVAPVPDSGERLARVISHLAETDGVAEIDLVGYSLGGVISRDAIQRLLQAGSSVRVRSLATVATPWMGSFVLVHDPASLPLPPAIANYVGSFIAGVDDTVSAVPRGPARRAPVWAKGYDHALDGLPLTRVAGTYFSAAPFTDADGEEAVLEANDGFATRASVLAVDADPVALPPADCFEVPALHSNYLADLIDEPRERGINWDPDTCAILVEAIQRAGDS